MTKDRSHKFQIAVADSSTTLQVIATASAGSTLAPSTAAAASTGSANPFQKSSGRKIGLNVQVVLAGVASIVALNV